MKKKRSDAAMALSVVSNAEMVGDGLVSVKDAMQFLGISKSGIYRLLASELPWTRVAGRRKIAVRALREYAAAGLVRQDKAS